MKLRFNLFLLAVFLPISLAFICPPAHAGHWVITFKCTGQGTSRHLTFRPAYGGEMETVFGGTTAIENSGDVVWITDILHCYWIYGGLNIVPVRTFPTVTHTWSDSNTIKPFDQYDPSTFYSTYFYDTTHGGTCSFHEYATTGLPVGYNVYNRSFGILDISTTVGNPEAGFLWASSEKGTISPVLTWTPDSSTDTSTPPLSVTVAEYSVATANQSDCWDQPQLPISADSGLSNASITSAPQYQVPEQSQSAGSTLVSVDTGGQAMVTLPPVSLSASGGCANDGIGTQVSLNVKIIDPIHASSTASPGPETQAYTPPQWFSGTACIAHAYANPAFFGTNTTAFLRSAIMRINGQVVRRYPEDYTTTKTDPGAGLYVMFDSTHFPDGTPIKIEVECHDSLGRSYTAHITAPAYNKLLALGNQNFGQDSQDDVADVESAADGINYSVTHSFHDNVPTILGELPQYTAFYIDSHGSDDALADCLGGDPLSGDGDGSDVFGGLEVQNAVSGTRVQGQVVGGKGNKYPPYNFVMFDACDVMGDKYDSSAAADDAGMSSGFGLPTFATPASLSTGAWSDRAALGWDWLTLEDEDNVQWTKRLWHLLAEGVPLRVAATDASMGGDAQGKNHLPPIALFSRTYTPLNPVIQGDPQMTLTGVYGGTTWTFVDGFMPETKWYKPL